MAAAPKPVVKSTKKPTASRTLVPPVRPLVDYKNWDPLLAKNAAETNPDIPVSEALLDADRRVREGKRQKPLLAKLATFDLNVIAATRLAAVELEVSEDEWQKSRRKDSGARLATVAKKAVRYVGLVIKNGRFLFRRDKKMLATLDKISEGDGLADVVADLKDLIQITTQHASYFDALKKTKGAAAKLQGFLDTLSGGSDSVTALQAQARRNLAFARLQFLSEELYGALTIVLDDADVPLTRVVNLRGYATRTRMARKRK